MFKEHLSWVLNLLSSSLKFTRKQLGFYWKINTFSFLRILCVARAAKQPTQIKGKRSGPAPPTHRARKELPRSSRCSAALLAQHNLDCRFIYTLWSLSLFSSHLVILHYMLHHHTGFQRFQHSIPVSASPNYGQVLTQEASNSLVMYPGASPILALKHHLL